MKSKTLKLIIAMTLLAELAMSLQLAAQEQQNKKSTLFIVSDLGTLGGTFGEALGINNEGLVSGAATLPGDNSQHLFLWIRGHKIDLGTLGGPNSGAFYGGNVNDIGQVVGNSEISTPDPLGQDHCFYGTHLTCLPIVWQDGLMVPLPRLRGGNNGSAQGINNRGQVSGVSQNGTPDATCPQEGNVAPEGRPVIWENGVVHELSSFPGDPDANGIAINDRGQVVGWSGKCTTLVHAVLWQNGTVTDLGNLGGAPQEGFSISATNINNQGQVVGYSPAGTSIHAFLWENGLMTDLGTLPGDFSSFAWAINSEGWVVGTSVDASGNSRAFIRDGDVMMDLNALIPADSTLLLLDALGINAHGEIVGDAMEKSTGEIHAYFLNPCYSACHWLPGSIAMGSDSNNSPTSRRLLEHRLARIHPYSVFGLSVPQK
jgi:probable HAF family extracellular repeat protein